jgi:hypothetical protein
VDLQEPSYSVAVFRLQNDIRQLLGQKRIPICVIRPGMDLTKRVGVDLLEFGKNVRGLVDDGFLTADAKLKKFEPEDEATWYDVE